MLYNINLSLNRPVHAGPMQVLAQNSNTNYQVAMAKWLRHLAPNQKAVSLSLASAWSGLYASV